jgi:hypothetical protein
LPNLGVQTLNVASSRARISSRASFANFGDNVFVNGPMQVVD